MRARAIQPKKFRSAHRESHTVEALNVFPSRAVGDGFAPFFNRISRIRFLSLSPFYCFLPRTFCLVLPNKQGKRVKTCRQKEETHLTTRVLSNARAQERYIVNICAFRLPAPRCRNGIIFAGGIRGLSRIVSLKRSGAVSRRFRRREPAEVETSKHLREIAS